MDRLSLLALSKAREFLSAQWYDVFSFAVTALVWLICGAEKGKQKCPCDAVVMQVQPIRRLRVVICTFVGKSNVCKWLCSTRHCSRELHLPWPNAIRNSDVVACVTLHRLQILGLGFFRSTSSLIFDTFLSIQTHAAKPTPRHYI